MFGSLVCVAPYPYPQTSAGIRVVSRHVQRLVTLALGKPENGTGFCADSTVIGLRAYEALGFDVKVLSLAAAAFTLDNWQLNRANKPMPVTGRAYVGPVPWEVEHPPDTIPAHLGLLVNGRLVDSAAGVLSNPDENLHGPRVVVAKAPPRLYGDDRQAVVVRHQGSVGFTKMDQVVLAYAATPDNQYDLAMAPRTEALMRQMAQQVVQWSTLDAETQLRGRPQRPDPLVEFVPAAELFGTEILNFAYKGGPDTGGTPSGSTLNM